jgi:hypothetical protein
MQRIIDPTSAASLPSPPTLTGTAGYFTEGSPGVTPATDVRGWWLNMMQEELISLLTAAGITPDTTATDFTQVLQAIQKVIGIQSPSSLSANGYKKYPDPNSPTGYFIEQWGISSVTSNGTSIIFPIAFPNAVLTVVGWDTGASGSGWPSSPTIHGAGTLVTTQFTHWMASWNGSAFVTTSGAEFGWIAKGY